MNIDRTVIEEVRHALNIADVKLQKESPLKVILAIQALNNLLNAEDAREGDEFHPKHTIKVFEQEYDGESLYDLGRDIHEAVDSTFNPVVDKIPVDEYNIQLGTFRVTIEWSNE